MRTWGPGGWKNITAVETRVKNDGWVTQNWGRGGASMEDLVDEAVGQQIAKVVESH